MAIHFLTKEVVEKNVMPQGNRTGNTPAISRAKITNSANSTSLQSFYSRPRLWVNNHPFTHLLSRCATTAACRYSIWLVSVIFVSVIYLALGMAPNICYSCQVLSGPNLHRWPKVTGANEPLKQTNSLDSTIRWREQQNRRRFQSNTGSNYWLKQQNDLTKRYIQNRPCYERIRAELALLKASISASALLTTKKERISIGRNGDLPDTFLLRREHALPAVFLNVNRWKNQNVEETFYTIAHWSLSPCRNHLLFTIQRNDRNEQEIYVVKISDKKPQYLGKVHSNTSPFLWSPAGTGFYFICFSLDESDNHLAHHRFEAGEIVEEWKIHITSQNSRIHLSKTEKTLFVEDGRKGRSKSTLYAVDLSTKTPPKVKKLLDGRKDGTDYRFIDGDEQTIFVIVDSPSQSPWVAKQRWNNRSRRELVRIYASDQYIVESGKKHDDLLVLHTLEHGSSQIVLWNLKEQSFRTLKLPTFGYVHQYSIQNDGKTLEVGFHSPINYSAILVYEIPDILATDSPETGSPIAPKQNTVSQVGLDRNLFEIERTFSTSLDGTKIPVYFSKLKSTKLPAPTLITGYGGFGESHPIDFQIKQYLWMTLGGVCAHVNVRGGNEYGQKWHRSGRLGNKKKSIGDFISAAEHLIEKKISPRGQMFATGSSNGGLLVASSINFKPKLFRAVSISNAVLELMKTKDWIWEFGNPRRVDHYNYLITYCPTRNLKRGVPYPATFIHVGGKDPIVNPLHSIRYAKKLKRFANFSKSSGPIFVNGFPNCGHSVRSRKRLFDAMLQELTFLWSFTEPMP